MILNVSSRTDICAYYSQWFYNRIKEGFVDVRNPFVPTLVSRILLTPSEIDAIIFCTKNPQPMLAQLDLLKEFKIAFQVTITPYHRDIEPYVPPKKQTIQAFNMLAQKLGIDHVVWRYDPILINDIYTLDYHRRAFQRLCQHLAGSTKLCIISFLDMKKNTLKHASDCQLRSLTDQEVKQIAQSFEEIAKKYGIALQTCCEDYDLTEFGITNSGCINATWLSKVLKTTSISPKLGKTRSNCNCLATVDIGQYNTCPHLCKYCYANYQESEVLPNREIHDVNSSFLIGHAKVNDQRKVRRSDHQQLQLLL